MKDRKIAVLCIDLMILLCTLLLSIFVFRLSLESRYRIIIMGFILVIMILALLDMLRQLRTGSAVSKGSKGREHERIDRVNALSIQKIFLLDEQDKAIKAWDLSGKVSLVIGKHGEEEVDIDLEEAEYSSFIDVHHAVLNYSGDSWYVEDLDSHNGIKIKKIEDGICYRVLNHPCKLSAGDILYIANTRLLLS